MTTDPPRPDDPTSEPSRDPESGLPAEPPSEALIRALAAHPQDMAQLMEELHRRVHDEDSLLDLMHRTSREAVRMITDVQWAGVTAQFAGSPFTAAHTDSRVLIVDEGQYAQGDGPCLHAMRTGQVVRMTREQVEDRWPILADAIHAAGVHAFHAEPLHVRDHPAGSLNLYSSRSGGLRDTDPDTLTVLIEYLNRGLTDYSATQPGEPDARRLQQALRSQHLINQAIGVLMAAYGITADQARDNLEAEAVGDITTDQAAQLIIERHTGPGGPGAGTTRA